MSSDATLTPRTVLITGGSSGIGLAIARRLTADGHNVAVTFNTSEPPPGLLAVKCDTTDATSIDEAIREVELAPAHGPVEVLVCSAGVTADQLLMRMSPEALEKVLSTNLIGPMLAAQRTLKQMMLRRWGRIIFIGSAAGLRGAAGQTNYAASKAGLIGVARSLAREHGAHGITANVIAPGLTDTAMVSRTLGSDRVTKMISEIPVPRIGRPEEVAAAVSWLAGEYSGYVTGQVIAVDGGIGMGH
ncbi:3-oxoacyl-ACP reductase FabG1 [Dactylosporangium maewongense]|uniref:3-oxoacyl-ACP reductase FabG1 n=1 Tax=Dactylosporangium maewongense TaxID=634393 RepID=A0ABP4NN70_9ACTN